MGSGAVGTGPYNFLFCVKGLAMPIYAYRCSQCGHAKDVLQKLSDPVLSTCPACGEETFAKQLTAAGFQLKGSGWYVTDFRDGNKTKPAAGDAATEGAAKDASDKPASGETAVDKAPAKPVDASPTVAPAAPAPAPVAAPAPAAGTPSSST